MHSKVGKVNIDALAQQVRTQNLSLRFELLRLALETHKANIGDQFKGTDVTETAEMYWNWLKENKGVDKLLG